MIWVNVGSPIRTSIEIVQRMERRKEVPCIPQRRITTRVTLKDRMKNNSLAKKVYLAWMKGETYNTKEVSYQESHIKLFNNHLVNYQGLSIR